MPGSAHQYLYLVSLQPAQRTGVTATTSSMPRRANSAHHWHQWYPESMPEDVVERKFTMCRSLRSAPAQRSWIKERSSVDVPVHRVVLVGAVLHRRRTVALQRCRQLKLSSWATAARHFERGVRVRVRVEAKYTQCISTHMERLAGLRPRIDGQGARGLARRVLRRRDLDAGRGAVHRAFFDVRCEPPGEVVRVFP